MDLRYAFRMLARTPGFTLMAVLTLAVCIGLNTVVFTVYESVAMKPLAVHSPGQVLRVTGRLDGAPVTAFSYADYENLRDLNRSSASVIATSTPQNLLCALPGAKAEALVVSARLVSLNYFHALGVDPKIGRAFGADERLAVVVSHAFWKRRLESDLAVSGKTLTIQGVPFSIVGVAPETFAGTGLPAQSPDLWIPLPMQSTLLPGVDEWQILSVGRTVLPSALATVDNKRITLTAKQATFFQIDSGEFETFGQISKILMVAVALILLIGCVNLVNLLLARAAAREREIAVRLALGSGRARIVRQLCTESALIGILGGALGFLISLWACEWVRVSISGTLQRISNDALGVSLDLTPDWRVFTYTSILSVLTGIAVGIWPALKSSRADLTFAMKQDPAAAAGSSGWSARKVLLGAQVAACLTLLAGAGLLFRGVRNSRTADPGFESRHMLLIGPNPTAVAATPAARAALLHQVRERVQALPEVASATWVDRPPFLGHGSGPLQSDTGTNVQCLFNAVSDRYFETAGIPLLAGRDFTRQEIERGEAVAIVSETAARQFWPGRDAIGRRVSGRQWLKRELKHDSFTVIGIVKTVRSTYLSKLDGPFVYFPKAPPTGRTLLLVRTRTAPQGVFRSAYAALSAVHSSLPSQTTVLSLEQGPMEMQRLISEAPAVVSSLLGLLALVLAAVGVYGVVAYLVTRRTREIGVHIALGAQNRDVIGMVLRQSLRPVGAGAFVGLIGAIGLSGLLAAMVALPDVPDLTYGAGAVDPGAFLGALTALTLVVLLASFIPVRRATRVEPADALRND